MIEDVFVHIGYQKTATTWLQNGVFIRHPEIAYLGKAYEYPVPQVIDIIQNLYDDTGIGFSVEENRSRWLDIVSTLNRDSKKILGLSDENLCSGIDFVTGQPLVVAERLGALLSRHRVRIIIGIREQCSMVEALVSAKLI
jgi:hypothetical protein